MKKLLAVGVIVLFLGLAIAPSINANISKTSVDSELVEITTEICGIDGVKPHTVLLSKEDAEEVEALFDSIGEQLNVTETLEEAEKILNDAIVQLDKYGLLGGLSVKQAQRIFKVYHAIQRNIDTSGMSENENANCIIAGRVTNAYFFNPISHYLAYLAKLSEDEYGIPAPVYEFVRLFIIIGKVFRFPFFPIRLYSSIALGSYSEFMLEWATYPSRGWILTIGLNGIKGWAGKFLGELDIIDLTTVIIIYYYVGVEGFFGIKIRNPATGITSLFGFARKVNIDYW